ncbi:nucleotidyltransferase family protein [Bacteroides faecalis]|nr:nucleotidyltransferase domain-containing protein [Bacteroides faecalis]
MRENTEKFGIGSVARGEQYEGNNIDVCVEIDKPFIFTLVYIKEGLEKLLKCPVDVVRLRNNMDELLKMYINRDRIYV